MIGSLQGSAFLLLLFRDSKRRKKPPPGLGVEDAKAEACWSPGMEGAVRRERGLPASPLQSQVTEENTSRANSTSPCERESCWKGKYLGIALPRGCRGEVVVTLEGSLVAAGTGNGDGDAP